VSASSRPFAPPVHVLVLPSKLPLDLRLNLRELDDSELVSIHEFSRLLSHPVTIKQNSGQVPDHMNLLSSVQAESHVRVSLHPYSSDIKLSCTVASTCMGAPCIAGPYNASFRSVGFGHSVKIS